MATVYFDSIDFMKAQPGGVLSSVTDLRNISPLALDATKINLFSQLPSGLFVRISSKPNINGSHYIYYVLATFEDVAKAKQIPFGNDRQFVLSSLPEAFTADKHNAISLISGGKQLPSKVMKEWEGEYDAFLKRSQEWREKLRAAVTIFDLRDPDLKNKLSNPIKPQVESDAPQLQEGPAQVGTHAESGGAAQLPEETDQASGSPQAPAETGTKTRGRRRRSLAAAAG